MARSRESGSRARLNGWFRSRAAIAAATMLGSGALAGCQGCDAPSLTPRSHPVLIGTTSTPTCPFAKDAVDFDSAFETISTDGPTMLCQPGDRVSLTSATTIQYVAADGKVISLFGPMPALGQGCG